MQTLQQAQETGQQEGFDYAQFAWDDEYKIRTTEQKISALLQTEAIDIIQVGKQLASVRDLMRARGVAGQGFKAWVEHNDEFSLSRKQAYRYIQCFEALQQCDSVDTTLFDASALFLLCSPGCSQSFRLEMVRKTQQGEYVTHREVKRRLDARKPKRRGMSPTEFLSMLQENLVYWQAEQTRQAERYESTDETVYPERKAESQERLHIAAGRVKGLEFTIQLFSMIKTGVTVPIIEGEFDFCGIEIESIRPQRRWGEYDIEIEEL